MIGTLIGMGIVIILSALSFYFGFRARKNRSINYRGGHLEKVAKPWGHEIIWARTDKYLGKILYIKAGHRLSKQYHQLKDESIMVLSGEMQLELGDMATTMNPGDSWHIPPGTVHRMIAVTDCQVSEVSTPELWDVVRLEDNYGRIS